MLRGLTATLLALVLMGCYASRDPVSPAPDLSFDASERDLGLRFDAPEVSAGYNHTCVCRASGGVLCWGTNESGELGRGTTTQGHTPAAVVGLADAVAISAGNLHTCARRSSGEVACWGRNNYGQLGDGTTGDDHLTPTAVVGVTDAVEISTGWGHTCARRTSGQVVCWGYNDSGQVGDGTFDNDRSTPTPVVGLMNAVEVSNGASHTCARRSSGEVACWGYNLFGQLGDGTRRDHPTPTAVVDLTDAVQISAGWLHTCARRSSGEVLCWGFNLHGELGDGTTTDRYTPTRVVGLADGTAAVEVSVGAEHTCARLASGEVNCWGSNEHGQLGDGTTTDRTTPTRVVGLDDAIELSAHGYHTCARRGSGEVVCWGRNAFGQLGDGTTTGRQTPTPVVGL
jgi:alpha-tubulin suppressor-like RCC1 family protein